MKLNLPKLHAVVTAVAVVGIALTFVLQLLSLSIGVISLNPVIAMGSAMITIASVAATGMSILLSLYRVAAK